MGRHRGRLPGRDADRAPPGWRGFTIYSLYVLAAVILVTIRDILSRKISGDVPSLMIALNNAVWVTVAFGLASLGTEWAPITATTAGPIIGAAVTIIAAYFCAVAAMRHGDIAVVAPFRYTSLVVAMLLGVIVFAERPDGLTLLGAGIVVATGIYTFIASGRTPETRCQNNDQIASTESPRRSDAAPASLVVDATPDRPIPFGYKEGWLSVRSDDAEAVARALGLQGVVRSNWASRLDPGNRRLGAVFLTPPVDGWTLVATGSDLEADREANAAQVVAVLDRVSRNSVKPSFSEATVPSATRPGFEPKTAFCSAPTVWPMANISSITGR